MNRETCSNCGAPRKGSAIKCQRCGKENAFPDPRLILIKCAACGREVSANAESCPGCGQPIAPPRQRTINHVTIYVSDVARSKAFYQRLTGLPIRDEAKDFCEFRLDGGFLGLYALEAAGRPGFDHFCFGIEKYDAKRVHALLTEVALESHPSIENEDQVYVRDPDVVRVQFADVAYKR